MYGRAKRCGNTIISRSCGIKLLLNCILHQILRSRSGTGKKSWSCRRLEIGTHRCLCLRLKHKAPLLWEFILLLDTTHLVFKKSSLKTNKFQSAIRTYLFCLRSKILLTVCNPLNHNKETHIHTCIHTQFNDTTFLRNSCHLRLHLRFHWRHISTVFYAFFPSLFLRFGWNHCVDKVLLKLELWNWQRPYSNLIKAGNTTLILMVFKNTNSQFKTFSTFQAREQAEGIARGIFSSALSHRWHSLQWFLLQCIAWKASRSGSNS